MGNDVSLQKSAVIDEKATEVTDYWSMYRGEWRNGSITNQLSLFRGETSPADVSEYFSKMETHLSGPWNLLEFI